MPGHELTDQEQEQKSPLESFLSINESRMNRVRESLSIRKQSFLSALPLLLHSNEASLPGFVSDGTPCGIYGYTPNGDTLHAARRIGKNTSIGNKAPKRISITGLYFMGSVGTISYTGNSDFDIWVFITSDLPQDEVSELEHKARSIEKWAIEEQQIEVHFHLLDPDRFRAGENNPMSSESSGSAQHCLLLEEFYRSSILIAGQPLTWWLVPPQYESHYDDYLKSQKYLGEINISETINLGGLSRIPPSEYFGAAMWQLNKSLTSPYKSLMKLLLMEAYSQNQNTETLISHRFKSSVYRGITDINALDPWLLMFEQIEDYLKNQGDDLRLNILRRSFYLKVSSKLRTSHNCDWKQELIKKLTKNWGWDSDQMQELDQRDHWKMETVIRERNAMISTLTKSFRYLSRDARQKPRAAQITQEDLAKLGRKLFSAFERKPSKVEIINHGIAPDIHEDLVSIHCLVEPGLKPTWILYRGVKTANDLGEATHLKKTSTLLEMISWCYFNEVLDEKSKIVIYHNGNQSIPEQEVKTLLHALKEQFPLAHTGIKDDTLSEQACLQSAAIFVNTGLQPKDDPHLKNTYLFSARNNALSYGGQHENLTITFDLVYSTVWGEVYIEHFPGEDALLECLSSYLYWLNRPCEGVVHDFKILCYSPSYGKQIRDTLTQLIDDLMQKFYNPQSGLSNGRYLMEFKEGYKAIEFKDTVITYRTIQDNNQLMNYLGEHLTSYLPVYFDNHACKETILPEIFRQNKPETLQLFFHSRDTHSNIYVLDEHGSLFFQRLKHGKSPSLLEHYKLFSGAVAAKKGNDLLDLLAKESSETNLEIYQVKRERDEGFIVKPISITAEASTNFLEMTALCKIDQRGKEQYTLYFEDKIFSSAEHGDQMFSEVKKHFQQRYNKKQLIPPVYITDLDIFISTDDDATRPAQALDYFIYKDRIETQLRS